MHMCEEGGCEEGGCEEGGCEEGGCRKKEDGCLMVYTS